MVPPAAQPHLRREVELIGSGRRDLDRRQLDQRTRVPRFGDVGTVPEIVQLELARVEAKV